MDYDFPRYPMLAAVQVPVIKMSQNRQEVKDRMRSEPHDRVNLNAEIEITELLHRVMKVERRMSVLATRPVEAVSPFGERHESDHR